MSDLRKWLQDFGENFVRWNRGTIVIDSWHEKEFKALGGDVSRFISCFEDNGEIEGAVEDYFKL